MLKTKSSNDVSIIGWAVATTVQVCYIFYGLFIVKEWQYIASCFCATTGTAAGLITALCYRYRYKHGETQENSEFLHCKIDRKTSEDINKICEKSGLTEAAVIEHALKMYAEYYSKIGIRRNQLKNCNNPQKQHR